MIPMKIQPKDKRLLLKAAMGRIPCDLAVTNVQYVNVFTGEIYPATVYVHDGFVVHVEDKDLASQVRNVDVIVGGHSHTLLHKKQLVKNPDGDDVVVVQNWKWGLNVGQLTIDF